MGETDGVVNFVTHPPTASSNQLEWHACMKFDKKKVKKNPKLCCNRVGHLSRRLFIQLGDSPPNPKKKTKPDPSPRSLAKVSFPTLSRESGRDKHEAAKRNQQSRDGLERSGVLLVGHDSGRTETSHTKKVVCYFF
jgi:hypothetical protein